MIISHTRRFVFLKTRKTAGTSVEIALSAHCGDGDVITRFGADDEALRASSGGRPAQNDRLPLRQAHPGDLRRAWRQKRLPHVLSHLPAADARRFLGDDRAWDDYLKFTVVRNPWDAVVSYYFWRIRGATGDVPTISEFLRSDALAKLTQNWQVYSIGDRVVVDEVVRYENLVDDLEAVRLRIGVTSPLVLPRAKGNARSDRRHYRDLLGADDAEYVARVFHREIEQFGYSF